MHARVGYTRRNRCSSFSTGWRGERGRVGEELLRRYAPREVATWSTLVCGSPAMVAEASSALQRLGVPQAAIQAEGFE